MLCTLCSGLGNLFSLKPPKAQGSNHEWWPCSACDGAGVRMMFNPPTIVAHHIKLPKPSMRSPALQQMKKNYYG